jgi:glycosyltransferase involved in cell wall biosynthesis
MRIAFYAPLKHPRHPVPSGDRRIARLLIAALRRGGHRVDVVSRFRSWDPDGDTRRQQRLERLGKRLAARLVRRFQTTAGAYPDLWFTYHVYYKAPDWLGPTVAGSLGIPYVLAEASHAPKRACGPWAAGHRATVDAIRRADAIVTFNRDDLICLPDVVDTRKVTFLPPFLDTAPYRAAAADRAHHRAAVAARFGLDPERVWLLAVGMMRPGDKLDSYALLAAALGRLRAPCWQLLVVGDGPARAAVEARFAGLDDDRVRIAGALPADDLVGVYAACDLFVWPAEGEAFGMAILEAQAGGLPVVAGNTRGVPDIVTAATGILVPPGDADAFAAAVDGLIEVPERRRELARAARDKAAAAHDIGAAAMTLDRLFRGLRRRAA